MRRTGLGLLAGVALVQFWLGVGSAVAVDTVVVIKIQDMEGAITFEMMTLEEYNTLSKRLVLERKYFDKAQVAAQEAWSEAGRYQGRQFSPRTAIIMLKTTDKDAATKKLNQLNASSTRVTGTPRTTARAAVSAADAKAGEKSLELLKAKLEEIISKAETPAAAAKEAG